MGLMPSSETNHTIRKVANICTVINAVQQEMFLLAATRIVPRSKVLTQMTCWPIDIDVLDVIQIILLLTFS